jgi:hypothetical protein
MCGKRVGAKDLVDIVQPTGCEGEGDDWDGLCPAVKESWTRRF